LKWNQTINCCFEGENMYFCNPFGKMYTECNEKKAEKMAKQEELSDQEVASRKGKTVPHSVFREDIRKAVEVMNRGGVILYPTDTVWGLGCDATNEEAVKKIYEIKRRADSKALITLVDSEAKVEFYVREVPPVAWDVIEMNTKPTTVIFDGARNLASNLLAEDGSVGMRITSEPFSQELCQRFRRAIVSTSANISGEPAPQDFDEISEEIRQAVDYIVEYRQADHSKAKPSTIIKLGARGEVKIIRA
jgi:L-threonylcarbamoyladenylate synthase